MCKVSGLSTDIQWVPGMIWSVTVESKISKYWYYHLQLASCNILPLIILSSLTRITNLYFVRDVFNFYFKWYN